MLGFRTQTNFVGQGIMNKRLPACAVYLALLVTGCAGGGGIGRSQCGSQQDCDYHITQWQNAIDTVVQANFPGEKFNAIVHYKNSKNAWVNPPGENINITASLLDTLSFDQKIAVAAHEIAHLKIGRINDLEADRVGLGYLIKAGLHERSFLSLLYWMREYAMENPYINFSIHSNPSARIKQMEIFVRDIEPDIPK